MPKTWWLIAKDQDILRHLAQSFDRSLEKNNHYRSNLKIRSRVGVLLKVEPLEIFGKISNRRLDYSMPQRSQEDFAIQIHTTKSRERGDNDHRP